MSKGGITKKIEDAIKALDEKQLKKALYLTESNPKLQKHHQWIREAAQTCVANKDDKAACDSAIKEARDKIQSTITAPIDDVSLDGLEEYLAGETEPAPEVEKAHEQTDEELYESCEECHVAAAASRFADICTDNPEDAGKCELIQKGLENEDTEPVDWIKAMIKTAEEATGRAKEEMVAEVVELMEYLERRNSPFLHQLDEEEKDA